MHDAQRRSDGSHHAEHARGRLLRVAAAGDGVDRPRIKRLGDGVDEERHPREAIRRVDRPRQERERVDALPILRDRELFVERRRIGHHPVPPVVMDRQ